MPRHILLIEPDYYSRYPPLGLLKLSAYHKEVYDDATYLVHGIREEIETQPDIIYITSLFTWAWQPVWGAVRHYSAEFPEAELWLGGLYASLMPKHAALSGICPDHIIEGIHKEAEELRPDYSLVPEWNENVGGSIIFSSRGCIRSCVYCAVPRLEGSLNSMKRSIEHLIWPGHTRVIFFDNNILANPYWKNIFEEIRDLDLRVDFNQGLDARLITEEVAKKISELKIDEVVRLSYDYRGMRPHVKNAIELLNSYGIDGRRILVYALYNFTDDPDDLFERIKDILRWGAVCYPMQYQPINALFKNTYIAPKWDAIRLDAVQRARRVIGYHGAFPPYEGFMKEKVEKYQSFDEAFAEFMELKEVAH